MGWTDVAHNDRASINKCSALFLFTVPDNGNNSYNYGQLVRRLNPGRIIRDNSSHPNQYGYRGKMFYLYLYENELKPNVFVPEIALGFDLSIKRHYQNSRWNISHHHWHIHVGLNNPLHNEFDIDDVYLQVRIKCYEFLRLIDGFEPQTPADKKHKLYVVGNHDNYNNLKDVPVDHLLQKFIDNTDGSIQKGNKEEIDTSANSYYYFDNVIGNLGRQEIEAITLP